MFRPLHDNMINDKIRIDYFFRDLQILIQNDKNVSNESQDYFPTLSHYITFYFSSFITCKTPYITYLFLSPFFVIRFHIEKQTLYTEGYLIYST
jgi:hypothetical protein